MNNLGRGPLEDAKYEKSKLYDFQFQIFFFFQFSFFVPMFQNCDPGAGSVCTPGTSFEHTW